MDRMISFGATHAAISAYLCSRWNLSSSVVEAVGLHHSPGDQDSADGLTIATAVHVARGLVDVRTGRRDRSHRLRPSRSARQADRVPVWAGLVAEGGH